MVFCLVALTALKGESNSADNLAGESVAVTIEALDTRLVGWTVYEMVASLVGMWDQSTVEKLVE